ncbi:MAG: glutamate-cysteine ligase family protein [Patescibacteria group bacterium]|nr:glutamate-cysteine ligase family protein [Patescibacteria group bacterium]
MKSFFRKFRFRPELVGYVGVEREFFLLDSDTGAPIPRSADFLRRVHDDKVWTHELSACQVEHRTAPCGDPDTLRANLDKGTDLGRKTAESMGCRMSAMSVACEDMPLDVYPDARYRKIAGVIPRETLLAACRVAGTHIHIGALDLDHAIEMHNRLTLFLDDLIRVGDKSDGERIRIYKVMAPLWKPVSYRSRTHLFETARSQGFEQNPRDCWNFVRISIHGTVEVRVFGASDDADEVLSWATLVAQIANG